MHDLIDALIPILAVIAGIIDMVRKSKSAKTPPPITGTKSAPSPKPPRLKAPTPTGYDGRSAQARLPEHARAMDSASTRLASGAEYPSIVAERAADRASEARFAAQVRQLEDAEPKRAVAVAASANDVAQNNPFASIKAVVDSKTSGNGTLVEAVILAELLGKPVSRRQR